MDDIGIRYAHLGNNLYVRANDVLCVFPMDLRNIREMYQDAYDMGHCIKYTSNNKVKTLIMLNDGRFIALACSPDVVIQRLNEAIICPASALPVRTKYFKKMAGMNMIDEDDDESESQDPELYIEPVDPAADIDDDEVELPKKRGRRKRDAKTYELRDSVYMD